MKDVLNGVLPKLPSSVVSWATEFVHRCLQFTPNDRPTFNVIFDNLKSRTFDLFQKNNPINLSSQQRTFKKASSSQNRSF